jgi:hypothetical protein
MFLLMHNCQFSFSESFNDALKQPRLFWSLRNGTRILDAKFVRSYLELFLGRGSYENPRENQVGGICFGSSTVSEHKMSTTTITFSLRKTNGPRKPEIFCRQFDCFHLDQARVRKLYVLSGRGPALGYPTFPFRC